LYILAAVVEGAVIEVTAGGDVTEPTYQFSDDSGAHLVNLTGSADKIKASGDLETGSGNSLDALNTLATQLAARLAAAEASIALLQATVAGSVQAWIPVPGAANNCAEAQAGTTPTIHMICHSTQPTTRNEAGSMSLDACKQLCVSQSSCQAIQWQGLATSNFEYASGYCIWFDHICPTLVSYSSSSFCMVILQVQLQRGLGLYTRLQQMHCGGSNVASCGGVTYATSLTDLETCAMRCTACSGCHGFVHTIGTGICSYWKSGLSPTSDLDRDCYYRTAGPYSHSGRRLMQDQE
jgi:hypothetical protein